MDIDVELRHEFPDEMLRSDCFLGFINDASIGTAVIGANRHHPLIGELLALYETLEFDKNSNKFSSRELPMHSYVNNNDLITHMLLVRYGAFFRNDGSRQTAVIGDSTVDFWPKETFEIGCILKSRGVCVHHCAGSWHDKKALSKRKAFLKSLVSGIPIVDLVSVKSHIASAKRTKSMPFYGCKQVRERSKKDLGLSK